MAAEGVAGFRILLQSALRDYATERFCAFALETAGCCQSQGVCSNGDAHSELGGRVGCGLGAVNRKRQALQILESSWKCRRSIGCRQPLQNFSSARGHVAFSRTFWASDFGRGFPGDPFLGRTIVATVAAAPV